MNVIYQSNIISNVKIRTQSFYHFICKRFIELKIVDAMNWQKYINLLFSAIYSVHFFFSFNFVSGGFFVRLLVNKIYAFGLLIHYKIYELLYIGKEVRLIEV